MMAKNKTEAVLEHLRGRGSITSMQAFDMYGATRLSAIIFRLRKQGYIITNKEHEIHDRFGTPVRYVEYEFHGKSEE